MSLAFGTVGVVGAGQMGSGIAQVCATYGASVVLVDIKKQQLDVAKAGIQRSAAKLLEKEKISTQQKDAIAAIHFTEDYSALKSCDLVVEAVDEKIELKERVLRQIESVVSKDCVIASNTSSISITKLAACLAKPERAIGLHFMNPVPLMNLVEVIPALQTHETLTERVLAFVKSLEKEAVRSKDYAGFIINRILMPMINEAFYVLMEGIASPEHIDLGMKLGTNQPMGPLQLADFIGLDTCLAIMTVLHKGLGDAKYRPCPLLIQYVDAGRLGRKTKQGVYSYSV